MNKINDQKGITIVSLIITIIVMLILAVVTISMVVGDEGVLTQAEEAGEKQTYATIKERIEMQAEYITEGENIGKIDLYKTEENISNLEFYDEIEITPSPTKLEIKLNDGTIVTITGVNGRTTE